MIDEKLTKGDIRALSWAIENADYWRGSLVGNPDTTALILHDEYVTRAKKAIVKVKKLRKLT
jgi:hypothetical protein